MSVTQQTTTFADLYTALMNAVRSDTSTTATISQAKRAINIALQDMHLGFDYKFPWAERSARLITQAQYTTGTCTATLGSTALSGQSTLWNTNNDFTVKNMRANGKILIGGGTVPYIISSVSSDTAAVLSSKFTEATETEQTYVYYEDEYDLASDFLRPVDLRRFSSEANIDLIGRSEFRRRFPSNSVPSSYPSVACINDFAPSGSTTAIRRVQFSPPPSGNLTIPYTYITSNLAISTLGAAAANLSADTDEPIIPLRYRHALLYHALYHWYRDKKDDTRSAEAKGEYTDIMLRIVGDVEIGANRPQIQPRLGGYARRAKRPWSGASSRRFDMGKWDNMGE